VVEVQAEKQVGQNVHAGDPRHFEARHEIRVGVRGAEWGGPERQPRRREVGQVKHDVEQQDGPAVFHGDGGVARHGVALHAVADDAGGRRAAVQVNGQGDVADDAREQQRSDAPEQGGLALDALCVSVEDLGPQEYLEVAEHMADREAE
jgi:hypothetical protein